MRNAHFFAAFTALAALVVGCGEDDHTDNPTADAAVGADMSTGPVCGTFCTMPDAPCLGGFLDCSGAEPTCKLGLVVAAGTSCGEDGQCDGAGTCVTAAVTADAGVDASGPDAGEPIADAGTDAAADAAADATSPVGSPCDAFAIVASSDDAAAYASCTSLRGLLIAGDFSLPNLVSVDGALNVSGRATELDLPNLRSIGVLTVDSGGLTTLTLPALEIVTGDVRVASNAGLTTIDTPSLVAVGGGFELSDNRSLTTVSFPSLVYVGIDLRVVSSDAMTSVSLPALRGVRGLTFEQLSNLTSITLNELDTIRSLRLSRVPALAAFDFSNVRPAREVQVEVTAISVIDLSDSSTESAGIYVNPNLTSVVISGSERMRSFGCDDNGELLTVSLPTVRNVTSTFVLQRDPNMTSLDVPNLTTVGDYLVIDGIGITTADFSSLVSTGGQTRLSRNAQLMTVDLSALTSAQELIIEEHPVLTVVRLNGTLRTPATASPGNVTAGGFGGNPRLCWLDTSASVPGFSLGNLCP